MSAPTPSQTVGPFFRFGFAWMDFTANLVPEGEAAAFTLSGRVIDGTGQGVGDAVVEIFQADPGGRYPSSASEPWLGFGRCLTAPDGGFSFRTVKPGRVDRLQAPHIEVSVFARGLLQRVATRIYFPDEMPANEADPLLSSIELSRRATLIARPDGSGLNFDVRLQGEGETVFFAW
ncbi:MAG: protocatechuate 3,4-dioxygenase subunit alpha [Actinomycetota bacterium]|nr:protocatechuate 3,4-dioxygenase subunit alpha [Actinomycetota bacterium]